MKKVIDITPIQKKKEKVKLAAYCRVSSNSEDQLHSYATQILIIVIDGSSMQACKVVNCMLRRRKPKSRFYSAISFEVAFL